MIRRISRALSWVAIVGGCLLALHRIEPGPAPVEWTQDGLQTWFAAVGPATATVVAIRAITLVVAWYLAAVTALAVLGSITRLRFVARLMRLVTTSGVRRLLRDAAAITVTATLAWSAPVSAQTPPTAVLEVVESDAVPTATLELIAPAPPTVWLVQRGDNLWQIARSTIAAHLSRQPTEREVCEYWQRVIALNTSKLKNPDLIYPDMPIELPTP